MRIGHLIRLYRVVNQIGIRKLAEEIGVSAATLSRLETGKPIDSKTMMALMAWLFQ